MKTKMKALIVGILLTIGATSGAYAQRGFHGGGEIGGGHIYYGGGPRVIVGGGFGYGSYWGWGYPGIYWGLGYPLYGYPYGYSPYGYGASRLQMQIADIKQDYADKIESVRSDNTLSGKERRQEVRQLKRDRDNAIDQAHRNYWRGGSSSNGSSNNGSGNNGSQNNNPSNNGPANNNAPANSNPAPAQNNNQNNGQ